MYYGRCGVRDFWAPPSGRRRLGAVLIKNRHSASGSGINEKNHSITELEAGFMLIQYASLIEIEEGVTHGIIVNCRPMLY